MARQNQSRKNLAYLERVSYLVEHFLFSGRQNSTSALVGP